MAAGATHQGGMQRADRYIRVRLRDREEELIPCDGERDERESLDSERGDTGAIAPVSVALRPAWQL
jgi:hypothetical protein